MMVCHCGLEKFWWFLLKFYALLFLVVCTAVGMVHMICEWFVPQIVGVVRQLSS